MSGINMNRQQRFLEPHPLKEMFRSKKITLWKLRKLTGVAESQLSRYFNRIDRMPSHFENSLYKLFFTLEGRPGEWEEIQEIARKAVRKMEEDEEALLREKYECKSKEEKS